MMMSVKLLTMHLIIRTEAGHGNYFIYLDKILWKILI